MKNLDGTRRLWSKKIYHIIDIFLAKKGLMLFAITGDLDNLGLFVSRHGRPHAENLVDVYNRMIGLFMYEFVENNSEQIVEFCMIPSGEEVFAIGVGKSKSVIKRFFITLKNEINPFIFKNSLLRSQEVSVSFGCKIFSGKKIEELSQNFVSLVKLKETTNASLAYLNLTLFLREQLALELDHAKFQSLRSKNLGLSIFFRNFVYTKLRDYKDSTREGLINISEIMKSDKKFLSKAKLLRQNLRYGVNEEDVSCIEGIFKRKTTSNPKD